MKKIILLLMIIINVSLMSLELSGRIHIILFDTSSSMIGHGDGRGIDILQEVKDLTVWKLENEVHPGDFIMIYPFSQKISADLSVQELIRDNSDKQRLENYIMNLEANGNRTYLTRSFVYALEETKKLKEVLRLTKDSKIMITIITDGRGNGIEDRGENGMKTFIDNFKVMKSDYPFMYTKVIMLDQNVFPKNVKTLMEREGVSVNEIKREELKKLKIQIVDEFYESTNINSYLHLKIAFDKQLIGETLELNSLSDKFTLSSNTITLKENKSDYRLRVISKNIEFVDEKIMILCKSPLEHKLYIGEDLKEDTPIKLSYTYKPLPLVVNDYTTSISENGKITLVLSQKPDFSVPTKFILTTLNEDISFSFENDIIAVDDDKIVLKLSPNSREEYKRYRLDIIYNKELKLKLKMESQHPGYYYQPETVILKKIVKPHPLKLLAPLGLIALGIGVALILL